MGRNKSIKLTKETENNVGHVEVLSRIKTAILCNKENYPMIVRMLIRETNLSVVVIHYIYKHICDMYATLNDVEKVIYFTNSNSELIYLPRGLV